MSEEATEALPANTMPPEAPPTAVHEYFRVIGARGGKSRSQAKLDAIAANLAKAQAARWKGKVIGSSAG